MASPLTLSSQSNGSTPASSRERPDDANTPLPPHIHSWLASIFHPCPIPTFECDATAIDTLTQLHSLTLQREQLQQLYDEDVQSRLSQYQQDNEYKASMLAALSVLPASLTAALPTPIPLSHSQPASFVPSASLSCSLSALTSLSQHLSLHSIDEPVMLAALLAHKTTQQAQHDEQLHLTRLIHQLTHHIHTTQHDVAVHQRLLSQLNHNSAVLHSDTQHCTAQLHTYTTKHKEYNNRLHAAQHKLKQAGSPTLSQLLDVRDEVAVLEGRLQRGQAEVSVWDGLSSDVRVARRQVAEAEMEVVRLEEEIERRLCAMSAFD